MKFNDSEINHRMKKEIYIEQDKTIRNLQNEFNTIYPFLKIEFFYEPHITGKGTAKNKMINNEIKLMQVRRTIEPGKIRIGKNTTVSEIEGNFERRFGLYVQVFRKSGNVWLETSATDNWTLEQQNEEGKSLAEHWKIESENTQDHDVY